MNTKQTIAIIGATTNKGRLLAKSLCSGNYRLLLKDQDPEELARLVSKLTDEFPLAEIEAVACHTEACWEADIIILALPATSILIDQIKEVANQKIVVATDEQSEQLLKTVLPYCKRVGAFKHIEEVGFEDPHPKKHDAFITGCDEEALETIGELVHTAGFRPLLKRTLENTI